MITTSRRHGRAHRALSLLTALGLVATTAVVLAGPAQAGTTLGGAAAERGRYFGAAITAGRLSDSAYMAVVDREFTMITPQNELRMDATQPRQGQFVFTAGDRVVNRALSAGQQVRGTALAWHAGQSAWLQSLSGPTLRTALLNHVTQVATHYQGKVDAWDVVNEAFADDGRGSRRSSNFQRTGDDWIEAAFRAARAADPDARLCYNDYSTDGINAKSTAVHAMVQDFRVRGVPIDCVGFQSHLGTTVPADYQANLQRFADLGVDVQITELDIPQDPHQADAYRQVVEACLAVARCTGITVFGVRDTDSWRGGTDPLLFDASGNKKPAYTAVLDALNAGGDPEPDPGSVDTTAWYVLVNRHSGKALDVYARSTANGARIAQWARNDGSNQQWQLVDAGDGTYRVTSRLSSKVLDVANRSTADGAAVIQWPDNHGAHQQWSVTVSDGYATLVNRNSGKVLEVAGASTADGGRVVQGTGRNGAHQQWQLVPVG